MIEGKRFTYQAVEGAHKALQIPDNRQARTFDQMFHHQGLFREDFGLRDPRRKTLLQGTIKSASISDIGMLLTLIDTENFPATIRTIADLELLDTEHLFGAAFDLMSIESKIKKLELMVMHFNFSSNPLYRVPEDITNPKRLTAPHRASQTVGHLHLHIDGWGKKGLGKLISNPRQLSKAAKFPKSVELRHQFAPHPLTYLARGFWQHESAPYLLETYPELFELSTPDNSHPKRPTDPELNLQLKPGLEAMKTPEFAIAMQYIQKKSDALFADCADIVWKMKTSPENATVILQEFITQHPFLNKEISQDWPGFPKSGMTYVELLTLTAKMIKRQATNPADNHSDYEHNREFWLQSNGTIGIINWNDRKPLLFLDIRPNSNSGIESAGLVKVRKPEAPSEKTHWAQMRFREKVVRAFRKLHKGQYNLGPEGEGAHDLIERQKLERNLTPTKTDWPTNQPLHIEDAFLTPASRR